MNPPGPNIEKILRGEYGYSLKSGVTTPLGIQLGQTLDEVIAIYGKPQRITWTPANGYFNDHIKAWEYQYPKDFTGTLMRHGYFLPNSGVGLYSLDFQNGILTNYRTITRQYRLFSKKSCFRAGSNSRILRRMIVNDKKEKVS